MSDTTPAKTIVALYDTVAEAEQVVAALVAAGVPRDEISPVTRDGESLRRSNLTAMPFVDPIGRMDLAMTVVGEGPVVAGGPMSSALGGAGSMTGALSFMGVPEDDARTYVAGVEQGQTLVVARIGAEQVEAARAIMAAEHRAGLPGEGGSESGVARREAEAVMPAEAAREPGVQDEQARRRIAEGQSAAGGGTGNPTTRAGAEAMREAAEPSEEQVRHDIAEGMSESGGQKEERIIPNTPASGHTPPARG